MKKLVSVMLMLVIILSSASFALVTDDVNDIILGEQIFKEHVTQNITDKEVLSSLPSIRTEVASRSSKSLLDMFFATTSTLEYTYGISCSNFPLTKAVAKSSATSQIDYIYARAKSYNYDGAFLQEAEDSSTNATYAGASVGNGSANVIGDYAYGNHVFRNSGYLDMVRETYAEW